MENLTWQALQFQWNVSAFHRICSATKQSRGDSPEEKKENTKILPTDRSHKITECLKSQGTFGSHLVQPPCPSRTTQGHLLRPMYKI